MDTGALCSHRVPFAGSSLRYCRPASPTCCSHVGLVVGLIQCIRAFKAVSSSRTDARTGSGRVVCRSGSGSADDAPVLPFHEFEEDPDIHTGSMQY
jgi:hypothetical protein